MSDSSRDDGDLVVDARDLHVRLEGREVLHGAGLQLRAGELVTVLGANGSGKSTLVRTIVGLLPAHAGEVRLFGQPLDRFRAWQRLGYVPQRSGATAGVPATVTEVVTSGLLAGRRPFDRLGAARRTRVAEAIDRVGLAHLHRRPVTQLSGGQHQRVLIARALVGGADLLVLDEPTAGVDREHSEQLADLLGSVTDEGRSVLVVAHDLGPMARHIDRAVVVDDGRVRFDGPVADLHEDHHHDHPHHDHDPLPGERRGPGEPVPHEGVW